jgi:hypothetical protein
VPSLDDSSAYEVGYDNVANGLIITLRTVLGVANTAHHEENEVVDAFLQYVDGLASPPYCGELVPNVSLAYFAAPGDKLVPVASDDS